jgi:hypothetical protein
LLVPAGFTVTGEGQPRREQVVAVVWLGRPRQAPRRARAEVAVASVLDKRPGALPVVAGFGRRLDLTGIIDRASPVRDVALSTHGQIIEVPVANRLTSPAPLLHLSRIHLRTARGNQPPVVLIPTRSGNDYTNSSRSI